jgi:chromosomal replication initiator protein
MLPVAAVIPGGLIQAEKKFGIAGADLGSYTIEDYVVSPGSYRAYRLARQVALTPGNALYNPFILTGPTGVGKTHLTQVMIKEMKKNLPQIKIINISGEKFLMDMITAIRRYEMPRFRNEYRSDPDVLIIDDISYLRRSETAQVAFANMLEERIRTGRQVVLTATSASEMVEGLNQRCASLISGGLQVKIQYPSLESRLAIAKLKSEQMGLDLSEPVLEAIVKDSGNSIRKIQGHLKHIKMFGELNV